MNKAIIILKNTIEEASKECAILNQRVAGYYETIDRIEEDITDHIEYIQELEEALKVLESQNASEN